MKRRILTVFLVCALGLALGASPTWAQVKGPIKVGVVGPHAGPVAWLGDYQKWGVILGAEEINNAGGILGQKLELVLANDAATPATSVASVKKLIYSDKVVAIVGPVNSSCAIAVGPVVTEAKVPILTNTLSPKVTEIRSPYVLRTRPTDEYSYGGVIDVLIKDRKYTKFAVLHDQTDFGMSGRDVILGHLTKAGIKPLVIETVNVEDKDFSGQLLNVKKSGAECMIVNTLSMTVGLMVKQKIQMGMDNIVLAGAMSLDNYYFPRAAGAMENPKNIEGIIFTSLTNSPDAVTTEYCKRYKARWNFECTTGSSDGSDYDALHIIKAAIEKVKSTDSTEIAKAIKSQPYHGVCGTYRFNERGDSLFSTDVVMFGDKLNIILLRAKQQ